MDTIYNFIKALRSGDPSMKFGWYILTVFVLFQDVAEAGRGNGKVNGNGKVVGPMPPGHKKHAKKHHHKRHHKKHKKRNSVSLSTLTPIGTITSKVLLRTKSQTSNLKTTAEPTRTTSNGAVGTTTSKSSTHTVRTESSSKVIKTSSTDKPQSTTVRTESSSKVIKTSSTDKPKSTTVKPSPSTTRYSANPTNLINFSMDDVIQAAGHSDCWFEATVASLAQPGVNSILQKVVQKASAGFNVNFFNVPSISVTDSDCKAFRGDQNPCTWATAIETAGSKDYPNEFKVGGDPSMASRLLTGKDASVINSPFVANTLPKLYAQGGTLRVATAGSVPNDYPSNATNGTCRDRGISKDHLYSLISVKNGRYLLRNPWGNNSAQPSVHAEYANRITRNGEYTEMGDEDFNYCFFEIWIYQSE